MRHDDVGDTGGERRVDDGLRSRPGRGARSRARGRGARRPRAPSRGRPPSAAPARSRRRPPRTRPGSSARPAASRASGPSSLASFSASTVGSQTIRAPPPRRDLDRQRVQSADAGVERDRAERADARHGGAHDRRALRRRRVVRLEHEARQPELGEAAREPEIVDAPLREVRLDVDVQVVGAADKLTCTR